MHYKLLSLPTSTSRREHGHAWQCPYWEHELRSVPQNHDAGQTESEAVSGVAFEWGATSFLAQREGLGTTESGSDGHVVPCYLTGAT